MNPFSAVVWTPAGAPVAGLVSLVLPVYSRRHVGGHAIESILDYVLCPRRL